MDQALSIITVCYNDLENLKQTINSLDEQSVQQFEHIIIDGHSGDGTIDFLQQLEVKPGRSFISQKDQGIFDAMNKGARLAKNRYLWFLNAGDLIYEKETIQKIYSKIESQSKEFDLISFKVLCKAENLEYFYGSKLKRKSLLLDMPFGHQGVIINKNIFRRFEYNLDYSIIADFVLVESIARSNGPYMHFDIPIAVYDLGGISSTRHDLELHERFTFVKKEYQGVKFVRATVKLLFIGIKYFFIKFSKSIGIYHFLKKIQLALKITAHQL